MRKVTGLSQEFVAQNLNMDASNYNRIEKGKISLGIDKLEQLAKIFQVDVCELVGCDGQRSLTSIEREMLEYKHRVDILTLENNHLKALLDEKEKMIQLLQNK
jgi:transcriptional regulator with XRE-family HTH domain